MLPVGLFIRKYIYNHAEMTDPNEEKPIDHHLLGGKKLKEDSKVDGKGEYIIINPKELYCGKSYSDWATDWLNWFLSAHADERNSGPVVFLRSHGLPNRVTGAYISEVPGLETSTRTDSSQDSRADMDEYQANYVNDPNIRIGSDRLQILTNQAIFIPIITAYSIASAPYKDWGRMQDFTGLTIDYGDNPPDESQITINNEALVLPAETEMENFRISTPIFPVVIPDAQYGTSIKDFLEDSPIAPGSYPALVEGYFVMLKFVKAGSYWIHSWASAPRERSGPYFAEFLYQIEVNKRDKVKQKGLMTQLLRHQTDSDGLKIGELATVIRPSRNESLFKRTLYEKEKIKELTAPEIERFKMFFRENLEKGKQTPANQS